MLGRRWVSLCETTAGVSLSMPQPHQHLSHTSETHKSLRLCTPSGRNKMSECYAPRDRGGFALCRVTKNVFYFECSWRELTHHEHTRATLSYLSSSGPKVSVEVSVCGCSWCSVSCPAGTGQPLSWAIWPNWYVELVNRQLVIERNHSDWLFRWVHQCRKEKWKMKGKPT